MRNRMENTSLLTSLATSFAVFMVLMVLYTWLARRPANVCIYYHNRIRKGQDPWEGYDDGPRTNRNPFAWMSEALRTTEAEMIDVSGVDTAVYFVFLSTVLGILVLSGFILLPMLLPVAAINSGNSTSSTGTIDHIDKYSIGNVKAKSSRFWAFEIAVYWVSLVSYYLLWKACNHVSDLRASTLTCAKVMHKQFAVLVRDIPPVSEGQKTKEQVDSYFRSIYPDTFYRTIVVTDNTKINKMWEELDMLKKELRRAEFVYAYSKTAHKPYMLLRKKKTAHKPEGIRPTHRTGIFGLVGRKVDTIEYLYEKIEKLVAKLEAERKVTLKDKQLCSALVFFTNSSSATAASQSLHSSMGDQWTVMEAPEPRQIIWSNLSLNYYERQIRQYTVYAIVALTILFYMIPLGFISALTTLANLEELLPFLKPIVDINSVRTLLEAYLPQLALLIFLALLPKLLMFLSVLEGIPSTSHATRATSGKYFYFTVFNAFIGVMIGGTVFSMFKSIEEDPKGTVRIVAANLSDNAAVFLNYVALKFFVGYGLELSRLVPLVIYHLKEKPFCKTEEELFSGSAPGDLGYETRFPGDMLIATIVLCYSVIAPLMIPFGVAYFGLGWLILRNQALKVYVPSYESYVQMWPHMHSRLVAALLLFQVTMLGYLGVKEFYFAPTLIPLPIMSLVFAFVCNKMFYRSFRCTSLEVAAMGNIYEAPNMEDVVNYFIPPALTSEGKPDEDESEDSAAAF